MENQKALVIGLKILEAEIERTLTAYSLIAGELSMLAEPEAVRCHALALRTFQTLVLNAIGRARCLRLENLT